MFKENIDKDEKTKKVSIIIPVYNEEKYIEEALKSIQVQTYTNIEVIVIDDGSTDETKALCDSFAKNNVYVKAYSIENSGVSKARNYGMKMSSGELIIFMDGDDILPENYVEALVEKILNDDCDVAFCGIDKRYANKDLCVYQRDSILSKSEYASELYKRGTKFATRSSCIGIYKKEIIEENNIMTPECLKCGEDSIFVQEYIRHANKIGTTDKCVYHYMFRTEESASQGIYVDHVWLDILLYEYAYNLAKDKKNFSKETCQIFMNIMARELMCYMAYCDIGILERLRQLKIMLGFRAVTDAVKVYKRDSKKKSYWMPIAIRIKSSALLYMILDFRKKHKWTRKKEGVLKSVFRDNYSYQDIVNYIH